MIPEQFNNYLRLCLFFCHIRILGKRLASFFTCVNNVVKKGTSVTLLLNAVQYLGFVFFTTDTLKRKFVRCFYSLVVDTDVLSW